MKIDNNDLHFDIISLPRVGQYVDNGDHGIKVTHIPTGITIIIPKGYLPHSQHKKRLTAIKMLESI